MAEDNPIIISMLRDQHRETMGRITVLEAKLESSRLEIKADLVAERVTVAANLATQQAATDKRFEEIEVTLVDIKTWRAKMVAYGSVFMFVITFVTQAFASGHVPGIH